MNKIRTNTLRIETNTTQQANFMFCNGVAMMMKKLKSENRKIEGYILAFHFNRRDAAITDVIGGVYKRMVTMAEQILGFGAQEVLLTASTDTSSDRVHSYNIYIAFILNE